MSPFDDKVRCPMRLRTATDIGAAIRHHRRSLGLDQATLAKKVGVSRQWIVEMERGKPRAALRLVLRTLEVLGIVLRTAETTPAATSTPLPTAAVDLDALLEEHRKPKERRS
jgi:HTH-type transcriptional regulator/antitoxin HipB